MVAPRVQDAEWTLPDAAFVQLALNTICTVERAAKPARFQRELAGRCGRLQDFTKGRRWQWCVGSSLQQSSPSVEAASPPPALERRVQKLVSPHFPNAEWAAPDDAVARLTPDTGCMVPIGATFSPRVPNAEWALPDAATVRLTLGTTCTVGRAAKPARFHRELPGRSGRLQGFAQGRRRRKRKLVSPHVPNVERASPDDIATRQTLHTARALPMGTTVAPHARDVERAPADNVATRLTLIGATVTPRVPDAEWAPTDAVKVRLTLGMICMVPMGATVAQRVPNAAWALIGAVIQFDLHWAPYGRYR
eukprot:gene3308-6352_t